MKTRSVMFLIVLFSSEMYLFSQQQNNPFVVSSFIGEKLDKIEENYFHLFPAVTNFQEATFYLNPDSSLTLHIKFKQNNQLVDTTTLYQYSLSHLRHKIHQILLTDISENRVEEVGLSDTITSYQGIIYSFDGKQIRLIEKGFGNLKDNYGTQSYLTQFNYSDIKTVTISESSTAVKIMSSLLGMLAGGLIGSALTQEPRQPESFPDLFVVAAETASKSMANTSIGIGIGGLLGFIVGGAMQVPVEYNAMDQGSKRIVYENRLLSNSK